MLAILKILITLAIIVILLNRKVKMGNAMLTGAGVLWILSGFNLLQLQSAVITTLNSPSTWEIVFALYFVMCLEYQLRNGGIVDGLMATARRMLRSERSLLALMPAFLGFLPSLGGAIFSAPLVESASKPYQLTAEAKTAINYWFRHIWEFTNPIFTGMLLASQLSSIPLSTLIANMAWLTALATIIGWLFFLSTLKKQQGTIAAADTTHDTGRGYYYVTLAAGPILVNFVLVVFFKLAASISMGLVVAAMVLILRQNLTDIRAMLAHALDRKLLWGIVAILFFQNILRQTGAIEDIAVLLNNLAISNAIVIGVIAFISGILTGTSQGFVAITFPFIAVLSPGDITLAMICFTLGTAGQMLSPAHLCLLVTLDYFKADFLKTLRPIACLEIVMIIAVYAVTTLH
jgi:integral membrane protein (TIGR00529 family)